MDIVVFGNFVIDSLEIDHQSMQNLFRSLQCARLLGEMNDCFDP